MAIVRDLSGATPYVDATNATQRVYELFVAKAATGVSDIFGPFISKAGENMTGRVNIYISNTATVTLWGSEDSTNWTAFSVKTASSLEDLSVPQYVKAEVTSYTSGTVSVSLVV